MSVGESGDAQPASAGHGFLGIQKEVQEDLLQFAGVSVNRGETVGKLDVEENLRLLQLMLEQRKSVANDLIQIGLAKLGCGRAREIQQAIGNLGCAEALLGDLLKHGAEPGITAHLFREHL